MAYKARFKPLEISDRMAGRPASPDFGGYASRAMSIARERCKNYWRGSKPTNLNTSGYITKRDGTDGNAAIARIQRDIKDVKTKPMKRRVVSHQLGEQRGKYTALQRPQNVHKRYIAAP